MATRISRTAVSVSTSGLRAMPSVLVCDGFSMVGTDARRGAAMSWEPLPDPEWAPTIRSLHRWSQIVGKVRMALAAPMNHWWHVTSYVSTRGLTTSPIPYRTGLLELEFDLHDDLLRLRTSDDRERSIRLEPVSVA